MTYLERIVAAHRRAAAADSRPLAPLMQQAMACPPTRGFAEALAGDRRRGDEIAVIAEVKRRSPSKGNLRAGLTPDHVDPADLARRYQAGGAACLSVLTDGEWFGGSPGDLAAARDATALPVLRKDFTVHERDVCDARIMGADCVLLIVAALSADELERFTAVAKAVGLDALVEVHDEAELEVALAAGATVVGVNQRDLVTFEVDQARALRMASRIPKGVVKVAESGIGGPEDTKALAGAGYDAVLVGETLVRSEDPAAAVRSLRLGA